MTMADRVAVLRNGRLQQVAPPQEIYQEPENLFVASFIGSPVMNLVHAEVAPNGDGLECHVGRNTIRLPAAVRRGQVLPIRRGGTWHWDLA
jgi:multiple sugar transport system ATP-binding protein